MRQYRQSPFCAGVLLALLCGISLSEAVDLPDCIAEKFYRFSEDHTACVSPSENVLLGGVSEADKTLIVNKHNELRALQSATDMELMEWDDEVAAIAQRWTDNCDFAHDAVRTIPGRFSVGQNLASGYGTWDAAIQGWYDEIDDFTFGDQGANVFSDVGHYTQLVWAKSAKIGCGYTECSNLNRFYACNYGPAGNNAWWEPYTQGSKCGDCAGSCTDDLCDCGGKVCENGGTLDLETCECSCLKSWHLPETCALNCTEVTEGSACKTGGGFYGNCQRYSNVPYECPIHCDICPYSGVGYDDGSSGGADGDENPGGDASRFTSPVLLLSTCLMMYFLA